MSAVGAPTTAVKVGEEDSRDEKRVFELNNILKNGYEMDSTRIEVQTFDEPCLNDAELCISLGEIKIQVGRVRGNK